ncbi:MAG: cytochrome b/b6 domain-containing protein [Alphaproteobacteria bacterium]|nr:cytochrome b/b6 domain-containing protein [Alphaproteobacteria bacterium]
MSGDDIKIQVWDPFIRIFHWLSVLGVLLASGTGFLLSDPWLGLHVAVGCALAVLLATRFFWGYVGSQYGLFSSFPLRRQEILHHLLDLTLLRPRHYLGHTPLGLVMVVTLMTVMAVVVVTGILVLSGEERQGPLAGAVPYVIGHHAKVLHGLSTLALLALAALHVVGVLAESLLTKQNLPKAMIDGKKEAAFHIPYAARRSWGQAAKRLGQAALLGLALALLALLFPPPPTITLTSNYVRHCGSCHDPFHPSLLSSPAWQAIVGNLPLHFGKHVAPVSDELSEIMGWLLAHAAETASTEPAFAIGSASTLEAPRITATPFWRMKHQAIEEAKFFAAGGALRCSGCHADASSGTFADQAIDSKPPNPR